MASRTALRPPEPEVSIATTATVTLKRRQSPAAPLGDKSKALVPELPLAAAAATVALKRRQAPVETKAVVASPQAATARPKVVSPQAAIASPTSAELLPAGRIMPVALRAGVGGVGGLRRVLCYGDSLTAGFCANGRIFEPYGHTLVEGLAAAGGGECEALVCGHSGHLAAEMVSNLDNDRVTDVASRRGKGLRRILREENAPELALIMAGTNDLGKSRRPEDILKDICRLHAECHARGVRTVALAPPAAPFAKSSSPWEVSRCRVKDLLAAWAQSNPFVVAFVDPSELVPPSAAGAWDPDRLHFSPAGSKLLGRRLAPLVLPHLLGRPVPAA